MRLRLTALLGLVALAAVLAGCGGGSSTPQLFTAAATAPCLKTSGFKDVTTATGKVGFIAGFAQNGGLKATGADGNTVTIAFTANDAAVSGTEKAFRRQAPAKLRPHMRDIMRTQGNAVLVWTTSPTQKTVSTVLGCLHS